MERLSPESNDNDAFLNKLREYDCIKKIEAGLGLDKSNYPLASVPEGTEFEVEDLRDSAVRFLNANIVADTFDSHQDRIAWYSESGVLEGGNAKMYLANKLRINILMGFLRTARNYGEYFARWHNRGRFHAPTKLPDMTEGINVQNYDSYSVEEKLAIVARVEEVAKYALNEMIDFGWIEGEKIG